MTDDQQVALAKVRAFIVQDGDTEGPITGPHHFSGRLAEHGPYMAVPSIGSDGDRNRQWRIYEDGYISWVS